MKQFLLVIILLTCATYGAANIAEFDTPVQAERYQKLIAELRCLVCQNQNLADSNAELALDLKKIVQQQISEGRTDQQILSFMTDRYGDFVLYRPPFKSSTVLLWAGPALFLLFGFLLVVQYLKKRTQPVTQPSEEQRKKVRQLLNK